MKKLEKQDIQLSWKTVTPENMKTGHLENRKAGEFRLGGHMLPLGCPLCTFGDALGALGCPWSVFGQVYLIHLLLGCTFNAFVLSWGALGMLLAYLCGTQNAHKSMQV